MKKLLLPLTVLILIGCSTFKLSTHNYDPIYGPSGNEIEVGIIETQFQLNRKLRNDVQFRYDFAQYAMDQPYSWYFQHRTFNNLDTLLIVVGITGVLIVGIIGTVATTVTTSGDIILQLITLTGKIEIETIEEYPTVKVEEVLPITTGM